MAENRGLTLSDLRNDYLSTFLPHLQGVKPLMAIWKPAALKEDADDQLSEIASSIPPVDPSCVELKHSAFLAQLLLEEVDLESTSERTSPVGKPVLHMQHTCSREPLAQSPDALARPASKNMPLSEHDTQELRRLLYLRAEGIECQERLQYLRDTWKSSIWSEEDDDSYTLPDPEIPLVYSLHYGQQCPPEWDDSSVPAETADRQKKTEHGKSNLHSEEGFLQKIESLNLDPRLKKLLLTYEEVFGALPPPLSCNTYDFMKSPDPKIIVAADAKKPTETVAARAFSLAESNFWLRNLKIRDYEALFARTIEDTNHPHLFNHDTPLGTAPKSRKRSITSQKATIWPFFAIFSSENTFYLVPRGCGSIKGVPWNHLTISET